MFTTKEAYESAEKIIREDRSYTGFRARGWAQAILRSLMIAAVATPVFLFWLIVLGAEGLAIGTFMVTEAVRTFFLSIYFVIWAIAFVCGPSPDAIVRAEVERLRNMLLARNMALDAIDDRAVTLHEEAPSAA